MLIETTEYLSNNLAQATYSGLQNIMNSPRSMTLVLLAILAWSLKDKIKNIIWLAITLTALGYGSIVIDGINVVKAIVS
jgi:hypothetical protein